MIETEFIALCQQKAQEYSRKVKRKRRIKKAILGAVITACLVSGYVLVKNNYLKSEVVLAIETEETIETAEATEHYIIDGVMLYKNLILTEDGYRRKFVTDIPEGTEVIVDYDDMGTEHPKDDYIHNVTKR